MWPHLENGCVCEYFSSPDLPALVRTIQLCGSVCRYGRGYAKLDLNEDIQSLLGNTTDKKDMKLLVCEGSPKVLGVNNPKDVGG